MIRSQPLIAPDTPLADRLLTAEEIGAAGIAEIAATMRSIGDVYSAIYDFRHSDFTAGPAIHAVEAASRETKA